LCAFGVIGKIPLLNIPIVNSFYEDCRIRNR
jgi:hypothetical protein